MNRSITREIPIREGDNADIPLEELLSVIEEAKAEIVDPERAVNIRIRIYEDEYEGADGTEYSTKVFLVYESPRTDSEQKADDEKLKKLRAEREESDKKHYERIRSTYEWAE